MRHLFIVLLLAGFGSCRERSELDGVYVNNNSDTITLYHTHNDWFSARLPHEKSSVSLKRNGEVLELKTASDSVVLTIKISGKDIELNGAVYKKVNGEVK